jgi:hypothetical protein
MLIWVIEQLVQRGRSNIVDGHLKGAMTVMENPDEESTDPTGVFLERVSIENSLPITTWRRSLRYKGITDSIGFPILRRYRSPILWDGTALISTWSRLSLSAPSSRLPRRDLPFRKC